MQILRLLSQVAINKSFSAIRQILHRITHFRGSRVIFHTLTNRCFGSQCEWIRFNANNLAGILQYRKSHMIQIELIQIDELNFMLFQSLAHQYIGA